MTAEKKPLTYNLGALMFYEEQGTTRQFEELPEEEQKTWQFKATKVLVILDKLNLRAAPKVDPEETREKQRKNIEILTEIIRKFVKGLKTTKPALFPHEELAHRILAGGK